MLLAKKRQFILYLQLIKKRLEIMLSDFAEKKETFFDLKKLESKNLHFSQGVTHAFGSKIANFFFIVFGQNKTRNNT